MLLLETVEDQRPGDTVALPEGGGELAVRVTALAEPSQELTSVEIVVNGQVARSFDVEGEQIATEDARLQIKHGSWIAARCTCRDDLLKDEEMAVYTRGGQDEPFRQRPSRLRYAHTSPIYVAVGGQETAVRESIDEGFRMLDQFEVFTRKTASAQHLSATLAAVEEARRKLQLRLQDAGSP
jgi:hypothetical protein